MAGVLGVSVFSILTYYSWNMSTILGGYFDMLYGALGLLILWFAEFLYMVLHPEYFIAFPGEVPIYIRFSKRETNIAQAFAHLVAKEISKVLEE